MPENETERRKEHLKELVDSLDNERYSAHLPFCQSPDEQGGAASCRKITEPRQSTGRRLWTCLAGSTQATCCDAFTNLSSTCTYITEKHRAGKHGKPCRPLLFVCNFPYLFAAVTTK